MHKLTAVTTLCVIGLISASALDPVTLELSSENLLRDVWEEHTTKDIRYNPDINNIYHLFTRSNPITSNPLLFQNDALLRASNFASNRRTIVLIHGHRDNAASNFNSVLVQALLSAENLNVIVVDWSAGSSGAYSTATSNTVTSGAGVARFIDWLNSATGSNPVQYHIIGHGLGGHQAGIAARRVTGVITYVTGLDPSFLGWLGNNERFRPSDGQYTEVIHTNAGINGYIGTLAQVDFYPNGGESMPGCDTHACSHERSFFYFAESVVSGGFTGRQCVTTIAAIAGTCNVLPGRLQLGGLRPKIGSMGIFYVPTNAFSPFSQD